MPQAREKRVVGPVALAAGQPVPQWRGGAIRRPQLHGSRIAARGTPYLFTMLFAIMFTLPFFWTLMSAFKPPEELYVFPPTWLPQLWQPRNFIEIWQRVPFGRWVLNSAFVALLNVLAGVCSSAIVAYGFSRFKFQGRGLLLIIVLSTMMLPQSVTIIPQFLMFRRIGWIDTLEPLIIPPLFGGSAFNIFLLRQFFMTIPMDYDEAAYLDGASSLHVLLRIILPLSQPALSTVAVFSFLNSWSNFMAPLIYLSTKEKFTLPLGLTWFQNLSPEYFVKTREHLLMAASVTASVPSIVLFFAAQKYFIRGIVMSGIKG